MAWDWTANPDRWVYLIEVKYQDPAGANKTARWCGPGGRTGSGVAFDRGAGQGPQQWETRLRAASYSRELGGIRNHVQTAHSLTFKLSIAGPSDPLMGALVNGRWINREIRAWFADLATGESIQRFNGRIRKGTRVTSDSASIRAIGGPLLLDLPWPTTKIPTDTTEWIHDPPKVFGAGGYSHPNYGLVEHLFHPSRNPLNPPGDSYLLNPKDLGFNVGTIHGDSDPSISSGGDVWRQIIYYGSDQQEHLATGRYGHFFHVSPQFGCYVHQAAFPISDVGFAYIRVYDDDRTQPSWIETFNNYDPAMGPVGTNCAVMIQGWALPTQLMVEGDEAIILGRISGPGIGQVEDTDESGSIEILRGTGLVSDNVDHQVIEQLFTSPELLNLPTALNAADLGTFYSDAEPGLTYRTMVCAVPRTMATSAPVLREVIGDLGDVTGWDLVERYDTANGELRLSPRRRRPSPNHPGADWTLRQGDIMEPNPGRWEILDDPESDYANSLTIAGPEYGVGPVDADFDLTYESMDQTASVSAVFDDAPEQAGHGAVVAVTDKNKWWRATPGGEVFGFPFQAYARAQPQLWTYVPCGSPRYAVDLCDTLRYEVAGLPTSVAQVRGLIESWDELAIELQAVHVTYFEGAAGGGGKGEG